MKLKEHELRDVYAIIAGIPDACIDFPSDCTIAAAHSLNDKLNQVHQTNDLRTLGTAPTEVWLALHPMFRPYLVQAEMAHSRTYGSEHYARLNVAERWAAIGYYAVNSVAMQLGNDNQRLFAQNGFSTLDGKSRRLNLTPRQRILYRIRRALKETHDAALAAVRSEDEKAKQVELHARIERAEQQAEEDRRILEAKIHNAIPVGWTTRAVNGRTVITNAQS